MRYKPEHKQANRRRLIKAGGALAKQAGFGVTGVDALAASASMTSGAFYTQFRSKDELLQDIVVQEMSTLLALFDGASRDKMLRALTLYLSPYHVAHPEQGCAVPALGAEIARADIGTRQTFEDLMLQFKAEFTTLLKDEQAAWTMISQAIGAIVVARAMATAESRDAVLGAVLASARAVFPDPD